MNRSQDDINIIKKTDIIVKEKLPAFASRYFKANMDIKVPRSLWGYALDLSIFFDFLETKGIQRNRMTISDLNKITASVIEDYLEYVRISNNNGIAGKCSDATIRRKYSSLSSFLNYYYRLGMIDQNPAAFVFPPKISKQVEINQSFKANHKLIDFISNVSIDGKKETIQAKSNIRNVAIVMLLANTGIKISELVSLNIENVHLDEHCIKLNGRKSKRTVYISEATAEAIGRYLAQRVEIIPVHGHEEALFLSCRAKRLCVRSVEIMIKKYSEAAFGDNSHITPESIRKSFRNEVFSISMNLPMTSDIIGVDQNTLLQYYRPYIDDYESHKGQKFK